MMAVRKDRVTKFIQRGDNAGNCWLYTRARQAISHAPTTKRWCCWGNFHGTKILLLSDLGARRPKRLA